MTDPSQQRRSACAWVSCVAVGLLLLLPLGKLQGMAWSGYARLWLIAAGLGYVLWQQLWRCGASGRPMAGPLMALGFIFLVHQFGGTTAQEPSFWLVLVVSLVALVARVVGGWGGRLDWMDWALLAAALVLASAAVLLPGHGEGVAWAALARVGACVLVWFAVRRSVGGRSAGARGLGAGLVGVLAIVSVGGAVQVASVPYQRLRGDGAFAAGDLAGALGRYSAGLAAARRLGLHGWADGLAFSLASVHQARGEEDQAAAALGLEPGFVRVVPADAWDGPEGGNLYYRISCWKDLDLFPGEVEIRVYASGTPAREEWPSMRVQLGSEGLGDVWVTSAEPKAYFLEVEVPRRSRRRLEITFLNDYYEPNPYTDRNLRVHEAEIQYRRVYWE